MVARIALTFSLILAIASFAWGGPYADLDRRLSQASSTAERERILNSSPLATSLRKQTEYSEDDFDSKPATRRGTIDSKSLAQLISLKALAESTPDHANASAMASEIKRSAFYNDPGEREQTNWLGRALDRLRNLHFDLPQPSANAPKPGILGDWIVYCAWVLLAAGVIVFLYFVLRWVDFSKLRIRRRMNFAMDDEEAVRTLDEWLVLADQLEKEGKYREAVRSLYLACLLKIDEARIARFDRGQTNWEHLARIEASPRLPEGLDFRLPTQAFDRIWYGYQVEGKADVDRFRAWYGEIVERTRLIAA